MLIHPREKVLHTIVKVYDKYGTERMRIEDEATSLSDLLAQLYAFTIGKDANDVRLTLDLAYPCPKELKDTDHTSQS